MNFDRAIFETAKKMHVEDNMFNAVVATYFSDWNTMHFFFAKYVSNCVDSQSRHYVATYHLTDGRAFRRQRHRPCPGRLPQLVPKTARPLRCPPHRRSLKTVG